MTQKNDSPETFFELLTVLGKKIYFQIAILALLGFVGIKVGDNLTKACSAPNSSKVAASAQDQPNAVLCSFSPLIVNIGNSCLEVVFIILFFEIRAKREVLKDITRIFRATESTKHIKAFHLNREDYSREIHQSFREARKDQSIKLLSLFEDIHLFADDIKVNTIRAQVMKGCNIKILILHPDSSLLQCLRNVGFTDSSPEVMYGRLPSKLERLRERLEKDWFKYKSGEINGQEKIKGSIEVRVHKDIFSSVGYYSDSLKDNYVWMYFSSQQDDIGYPAFHIITPELIREVEKHFDSLWERATRSSRVLEVTAENGVVTSSEIISDVFSKKS